MAIDDKTEKRDITMTKNKLLFYDKNNDILAIHKGFSADEKFKGNIDAGQLVLDVSTKGRVVGIEIMHATEFFALFTIGRDILENLEDAKFTVTINPNGIVLGISFKVRNREEEIPAKIAVPLEVSTR